MRRQLCNSGKSGCAGPLQWCRIFDRNCCARSLRGLPKPVLARLHAEVIKILEQPDIRERIVADGSEPVGSAPEEFRQFMRADLDKWSKLVKGSGVKFD